MNNFDWKFWLIVIICYVVSIVTTLTIIWFIHLFDNVDASLTLIDQCLENATENSQITVDGYKLC
jgi:hypothetical protein